MLLKYQRRVNELENVNVTQEKVIQDFEIQQILSFIEIERICLNNNELQQQVEYFKDENNKLKSVRFIKNLSFIKKKRIGFPKIGRFETK